MIGFKRAILSALLATSLAAGFAAAQDAPPAPDSQYPAASDSGQSDPGYYATQNSQLEPQGNDLARQNPQYQEPQEPVYERQNDQPSNPAEPPADVQQQQDQGGYPSNAQEPSADAQQPEEGGYPATAQSAPPSPDGSQPDTSNGPDPSSRVARMQFMDGQVSIQPGGVNDWVAGTLNRPMTTGDNVWTDKDSKAELNVGTGVFRMGAETSMTLANVADNTTQVQVHQGTLNLRVRHLYNGEVYEIDTPNMAFTVQQPGDYRIDVDPNADTSYITVWKGEGNATGDGPSVAVRQGERARFSNGTSMAYQIDKAPGYDQFDQWAMSRDHREDNSASARYVSPDVIGSSELDDYGTWKENSEYGNVWVPNDVGADWQPYSNGNWIYQQPYGWTWVGYEPWGFAPYHYGRWVYGGWGWGWAPGPYAYWGHPYYAPALVAWFGGGGFGLGWGGSWGFGGGWGWCALGWGEPYHPWYHHDYGYFRNVNIRNTRIRNINNYYGRGYNGHYANVGHGLVATNGRTITNGMNVRNNRIALNNSQRSAMMQHPAMSQRLGTQLRPTAQSRFGAQAASRHAVTPPSRAVSRPTVSRMTPPGGMNGRNAARSNIAVNHGRFSAPGNGSRPSAAINNGRSTQPSARSQQNVPRPSNSGGNSGRGMANQGGAINRGPANNGAMSRPGASSNGAGAGHYVPRPPSAGGTIGNRASATMPSAIGRSNTGRSNNGGSYGVARPGSGAYSRPGQSYSAPNRGYSNPGGMGRSYSAPNNGGSRSYSPPSNARSYAAPSYGGRGYSSPSPNYGGSARSAPTVRNYSPSYGGGSARNYGGGGGGHYAAPAYHGGGGGGGHYSAPAYHGGGGGFGGGGHAGGGGGHPSGGGGGHPSGGGGGHGGGGGSHGGHR
jgi:hypothetical protein